MIIAVDIGGTKAEFGCFTATATQPTNKKRFACAKYHCFEDILKEYATSVDDTPQAVSIGVAGPVVDQSKVEVTNLPWVITSAEVREIFPNSECYLLNDLLAQACGIRGLDPNLCRTLQTGQPLPGNKAVIAPGTGLGQAMLHFDGQDHRPLASEGGHRNFSPDSLRDLELLRYLMEKYVGHVSCERVVSGGDGFENLWQFQKQKIGQTSPTLESYLAGGLSWGEATVKAAEGGDEQAQIVLRWYVELLGVEAGNLALTALSISGLYIAGGIAPNIIPWLEEPAFLAAFARKGRYERLMRAIPIHIVLDEDNCLRGAAAYGFAMATSSP